MPTLVSKTNGGEQHFELSKSVTSIGRDQRNDVRIDSKTVKPRHAHILKAQDGFRLFAVDGAPVSVNGKRRPEFLLEDGDRIELGDEVALSYHLAAPPKPRPVSGRRDPAERVRLEAFKKLHSFTANLSTSPSFEALETNLLDAVIELADADTGALMLFNDEGRLRIDLARDRHGRDLPKDSARISDSIIRRVVAEKRPVLLADAQEHSVFGESDSVINFEIRSVVAIPILLEHSCLGVLYLGSDRVTDTFSEDFLEVLTVFGAQAGLLVQNARLISSLEQDNKALKEELRKAEFGEIVGGCRPMQEVFRMIARLAPADISVLVYGETGTGKELVARELHRRSPRAQGPFIAINVAAIPENLLEAELFGYVKGAFTGAISDRQGKFAAAHGGTLFLDEIGDMPLGLQAKLLRVLQDRMVEPIGSNRPRPIDIRLVCATHRDLQQMQAESTFRSDLYFRINEAQILLPPLRDRSDDIALLANYFLVRFNEQLDRRIRRFTPQALAALKRYRWPGNVRELEAKVKNAVVMCDGGEIGLPELGLVESALESVEPLKDAKERFARQYIEEVLDLNGGNRSKTARELGIDPRTVYKYLEGR